MHVGLRDARRHQPPAGPPGADADRRQGAGGDQTGDSCSDRGEQQRTESYERRAELHEPD